ncbi:SGNH/GDSL hydrolase family protein [soil metagenome]
MRPRLSAEAGQSSLEWLGIGAIAVGLVLALVTAAPVMGESIVERFRCLLQSATSLVTGADPGSCAGAGDGSTNQGGAEVPERTPLEHATQGDYIAIGDSFSSGEGAGEYGESDCHRSPNGYPSLIADTHAFGGDVINVTCSGARIEHVNGADGQHGEGPQIDAITGDASLITIGISGNDTGWTDVVSSCATGGSIGGDICGDTAAVRANMDAAIEQFDALLQEIMSTDHDARVIALGYPRFFPDPPEESWTYGCNPFGCLARISVEDQAWMNELFRDYNDALAEVAATNGVEFVDVHDAFTGCELTTSGGCMNGLVLDGGFRWPPVSANPGSFHPNAQGQQALADLLLQQIENP